MNLMDLVVAFTREDVSVADKQMLGKVIVETVENVLDSNKAELEKLEEGTYINQEIGKKLVVGSSNKSTLDSDAIGKELSVGELRKLFKATESGLQKIKRLDLIEKYKMVEVVKSSKVLNLSAKDVKML